MRPSLRLPLAAGALLAAGAAGAWFLTGGSGTQAPARAPAAATSQAALLVQATARQLDAEGTVRVDSARTRLGVSAEGERLVYRMRLDAAVSAADVAAIRAQDSASVCEGIDSSRLVALGGSFEHLYTDAQGNAFSSVVTSCPGGGAAARSAMPVAM
jgi:hypothetical protein